MCQLVHILTTATSEERRTSSHQFNVEVTGAQKPSMDGLYGKAGNQECMLIVENGGLLYRRHGSHICLPRELDIVAEK